MKITIRSTDKIVMLRPDVWADGVPARIWEGETESGIRVQCFIARVAIDSKEPRVEEFQRELLGQDAPSTAIEAYSLSLIL